MSRYIDADKFLETVKEHQYLLCSHSNSQDYGMFTTGIKQALDEQPTADVAEVKRGYWVLKERLYPHCSICGKPSDYECDGTHAQSKYCPNCGARVDGDKE